MGFSLVSVSVGRREEVLHLPCQDPDPRIPGGWRQGVSGNPDGPAGWPTSGGRLMSLVRRERTPPGRPSSGTTETGSPRWTSSRCAPRCSASFMCFSSSATDGAPWSAAPSPPVRLLPGWRSSYQSPWQDGVAERFVGRVRRELLDHVIVLNERHLRQMIESLVTYCNVDRTHIGVGKDSPCGRPVEQCPGATTNVVSLPRVGGLHHRYAWRKAAQAVSGQRFLWTAPAEASAEGIVCSLVGGAAHPRVWPHDRGPVSVGSTVPHPASNAVLFTDRALANHRTGNGRNGESPARSRGRGCAHACGRPSRRPACLC